MTSLSLATNKEIDIAVEAAKAYYDGTADEIYRSIWAPVSILVYSKMKMNHCLLPCNGQKMSWLMALPFIKTAKF